MGFCDVDVFRRVTDSPVIVSSKIAVFRRVTGSPKLVFTSVVESSTQWLIVLRSGSGFANPFCPVGSSKTLSLWGVTSSPQLGFTGICESLTQCLLGPV